MKRMGTLIIAVLITVSIAPSASAAAEREANWRQRVSTADDVVASDISEEIKFGREVAARILGRYGYLENPKLTKYLNLVGRSIAMHTSRPELEFRFALLDTAEVNAYATPGGYVFVTRGALEKMTDEAELAGVLAHEIAHITEKHVVKELNIRSSEATGVTGLALLIGGGSEAAKVTLTQLTDKAVDILFKDGYKREDEVQADKHAVMLCSFAGYDPQGLVRYFERLNTVKGKSTEILDKTHPSYEARIAWIKSVITEEGMDAGSYAAHKERFARNRELR